MKKNVTVCPSCRSENVARYLYGMPAFSKKLEIELEQGKIKLGGCCIVNDAPSFHCNECGKEWGDKYVNK